MSVFLLDIEKLRPLSNTMPCVSVWWCYQFPVDTASMSCNYCRFITEWMATKLTKTINHVAAMTRKHKMTRKMPFQLAFAMEAQLQAPIKAMAAGTAPPSVRTGISRHGPTNTHPHLGILVNHSRFLLITFLKSAICYLRVNVLIRGFSKDFCAICLQR